MEEYMSSQAFGHFLTFKLSIAVFVAYLFYRFAQRDATAYDTIYRKRMRYAYVVLSITCVIWGITQVFNGPFDFSLPWYNISLYGTPTPTDDMLIIGHGIYANVHYSWETCHWSRQTFDQWNMANGLTNIIVGIGLVLYSLRFRRSSIRWHAKVRKFLGYTLLFAAPSTIANTLHYFTSDELFGVAVFVVIVYLLCRPYPWDGIPAKLPKESVSHPGILEFEAIPPQDQSRILSAEEQVSHSNKIKKWHEFFRRPYMKIISFALLIISTCVCTGLAIYYSQPNYWFRNMRGWEEYGNVVPEYGVTFINRDYKSKFNEKLATRSRFENETLGTKAFVIFDVFKQLDYHSTDVYKIYKYYQECHVIGYHILDMFLDSDYNETSRKYLTYQKELLEKSQGIEVQLDSYNLFVSPSESKQIRAISYIQKIDLEDLGKEHPGNYTWTNGDHSAILYEYRLCYIFCVDEMAYEVVYVIPNENAQTNLKYSDLIISPEVTKMCNRAKLTAWILGIIAFVLYIIIGLVLVRQYKSKKIDENAIVIKNEKAKKLYKRTLLFTLIESSFPVLTVWCVYIVSKVYDWYDGFIIEEYLGWTITIIIVVAISTTFKYYMLRYLKSRSSEIYAFEYLIPDWYKNSVIATCRNKEVCTKLSLLLLFYPIFYVVSLPCGIIALAYLVPIAAIFAIVHFVRWIFRGYTPLISFPKHKHERQELVGNQYKEKLQLLKNLLDEGLITQEDYNKKKDEFLKNLE